MMLDMDVAPLLTQLVKAEPHDLDFPLTLGGPQAAHDQAPEDTAINVREVG